MLKACGVQSNADFNFFFRNSLLNMAPVIFCFILGERRKAAVPLTHLALAFAGGGT